MVGNCNIFSHQEHYHSLASWKHPCSVLLYIQYIYIHVYTIIYMYFRICTTVCNACPPSFPRLYDGKSGQAIAILASGQEVGVEVKKETKPVKVGGLELANLSLTEKSSGSGSGGLGCINHWGRVDHGRAYYINWCSIIIFIITSSPSCCIGAGSQRWCLLHRYILYLVNPNYLVNPECQPLVPP